VAYTLRKTLIGGETKPNDYEVMHEGRSVGRIREAGERIGHAPGWDWTITIPLPLPAWGHGSEDGFDQAKAAFRKAWERFYSGLSAEQIERWHKTQNDARRG
jgi:hypothetical protein